MENINFKRFRISELLFNGIHVMHDCKVPKKMNLTICDHFDIEVRKGSENLYLDITVYNADDQNDDNSYTLSLYTKDNHLGLKEITKEIINQA